MAKMVTVVSGSWTTRLPTGKLVEYSLRKLSFVRNGQNESILSYDVKGGQRQCVLGLLLTIV